uniref:Uncharacterized protein n=1 Tax=Lactuca sativa TaxID=4236 RepID=A0A9R1VBG9_LACSA|nr:hypothetical protein LSAT_V11C500246230 [Lactuca sativa]
MEHRELAYLQEINPNQFLSSLDENSNAKGDLEEIERLIKDADHKESFRKAINTLCEPDVQFLHDYLKNPLKENKVVKDHINFEDAHLGFLETVIENNVAVQDEDRGSLGDKGDPKTLNGEDHNPPIGTHMLDQERMSIKNKRTKPRASVSTTFDVLTFKTLYSIKKDEEGREPREHENDVMEKK